MSRRHRLVFGVTALLLGLNLIVGYRVYSRDELPVDQAEALQKISVMMRVLHLIRQDYVDAEKVDYSSLVHSAMRGMVSSLDPYSSFLEPADFEDMMETTEGQFGGLGIQVTTRDGWLTVVTPIEGTPGSRAGILAGDRIVEVDGQSTRDLKLSESVQLLKGDPGTDVTLKIFRAETGEEMEVVVERAIIEVPSVKDVKLLDDGIAYVRVTQFDELTAPRLQEALEKLEEQGMTGLILDLRNNPGGLLRSAVDVCSLFLPAKELVVFTQGRQPSQRSEYLTKQGGAFTGARVVILVNRGSASAAEIVAGCLKDSERAILIGNRTFGKGSVQNVIRLPDGSALRLTTAMYYTPSKTVIHEHGIEPHIAVSLTAEEMQALRGRQRLLNGVDGLDLAHDSQLARAVEVLKSHGIFSANDRPGN